MVDENGPQDGPKMALRWPQDGLKMAPRLLQDVPKMASRWPQNAPKMLPRGKTEGYLGDIIYRYLGRGVGVGEGLSELCSFNDIHSSGR